MVDGLVMRVPVGMLASSGWAQLNSILYAEAYAKKTLQLVNMHVPLHAGSNS